MTEKQFEIICEDYSLVDVPVYVIAGDKSEFDIYGSKKDAKRLCALLNENEQLKQEHNKLKHKHSLLHDVCIEAECDRDMYQNDVLSLEKENGYLKFDNEELKSKVIYEKRQHRFWKKECIGNINEIAQLKREIVQLKGGDGDG